MTSSADSPARCATHTPLAYMQIKEAFLPKDEFHRGHDGKPSPQWDVNRSVLVYKEAVREIRRNDALTPTEKREKIQQLKEVDKDAIQEINRDKTLSEKTKREKILTLRENKVRVHLRHNSIILVHFDSVFSIT